MSAPRFEIVQADAEQPWHARSIAGNGEKVLWSETYAERRAALEAIRITAQLFSVTPAYFNLDDGILYLYAGGMRVEVRDVDERDTTTGVYVLEPCDQCRAGRDEACREGCDEMRDCRSIV